MSHCAKKARHNRAKIFYMSPGSPCLLPFFVCHGLLPADMRLVALFAHEDFCNLTLCCFLKFLFLYNKVMAFCLCPHCFWQHLFRAVHPPADVCCWQSLQRKNNFNVISQCNVFARFQAQFQHKNLHVYSPSSRGCNSPYKNVTS